MLVLRPTLPHPLCTDYSETSVPSGFITFQFKTTPKTALPYVSMCLHIAGKVRDLYQAVAKVLHLPSQDPQKLLLLAEYDSSQTLTMHTKGSEPLSTVQITNGPGAFSSSKPLLLAYHYASPEQGPASGKQLLVYHR